jgi:hypothetical protein
MGRTFPRTETWHTEVTIYSDMLEEDDGILLEGLQEAFEFLQLMPLHIKHEAGGRGWPVAYSLLPVDMIGLLLQVQTTGAARATTNPASDCLDAFVQLFDQYQACRVSVSSSELAITANKSHLPTHLPELVADRQRKLQTAVCRLKTDYAHTLEAVRTGKTDHAAPWNLLSHYAKGDLSPRKLGSLGISGIEAA